MFIIAENFSMKAGFVWVRRAGISLLTGAVHLGGFADKTSPRSSNPARN